MRWWTLILACLCVLWRDASADTPEREAYLKAYDQRVDHILSAYDTSRSGFYAIAVRYARNQGVDIADSLFLDTMKNPRGDMFWMFPCIGAYMHGTDRMSPAAKAAVRNAWKTYMP